MLVMTSSEAGTICIPNRNFMQQKKCQVLKGQVMIEVVDGG